MTVARFLVISLNTGKVFEYDHPAEVDHYNRHGNFTVVDTHRGKYTSTAGGGKNQYIPGHPKITIQPSTKHMFNPCEGANSETLAQMHVVLALRESQSR